MKVSHTTIKPSNKMKKTFYELAIWMFIIFWKTTHGSSSLKRPFIIHGVFKRLSEISTLELTLGIITKNSIFKNSTGVSLFMFVATVCANIVSHTFFLLDLKTERQSNLWEFAHNFVFTLSFLFLFHIACAFNNDSCNFTKWLNLSTFCYGFTLEPE